MRTANLTSPLAAVLLLSACGGPSVEEPASPDLQQEEHALSYGISHGCTFSTTYREVSIPHAYVPIIKRKASATCPWSAATLELEPTYSVPNFKVIANEVGVAVLYATQYSPSGSSGFVHRAFLWQVVPETLSLVRQEVLASYGEYHSAHVSNVELSLLSDGTTLKIKGRQEGAILGQTGSGTYFVSTWPDFFTSQTPPNVVASPVWIP